MNQLERREFLKGLTAVSAALTIYPNDLFEAIMQEADAFLWTREEILFAPRAGFEQARAGQPLGIYLHDGVPATIIEPGMTPWNNLARECGRNDLFYIENNPSDASIEVTPGIRFWVRAYPDYVRPFERCVVELNVEILRAFTPPSYGHRYVAHELGHTLGFVDFVFARTSTQGLVNPQRCDLSDKPIRSIMAENSRWFGEDDPKMLKLAGYV